MISRKFAVLALPMATGLALTLSAPIHAQSNDVQAARSQVQWALGNIDQLMAESRQMEGEGRELDREQKRLKDVEFKVNTTINNFNMNCRSAGTRANQCPSWAREINEGQAYLDREYDKLDQRYNALNSRVGQLKGRIDQMRMRMMDNVQMLAAACRNAPQDVRGAQCNIPGAGRFNGGFVNEAQNYLRANM